MPASDLDRDPQRPADEPAVPRPSAGAVTCDEEPLAPSRVPAADSGSGTDYPVQGWDRYDFVAPLGMGGMGVVYKAHDRRLGRPVALKFIRGGDPHLALRFMQEARAQARITHDNVCKVYEVGQIQGRSYIVMELLTGASLEQARAALGLPGKLEIIRQVARGLHEAHRLGIIHRDVKPANIMVERRADGSHHAVVMDFGLARHADDGQGLTESGALLGTPAFMSPEQARGDVRNLDRRSDVYSLGATLYCLLVGEPPFAGASTTDILLAVIYQDAVPIRWRVPTLPTDLETIVMKCLEKDPTRRYDSALALAEELDRYVAGEPIKGRRSSIFYRLQVRARKHKVLVVVSVLAALGVAASSAVALRTQWRATTQVRLTQQFSEAAKEAEVVMQRAHLMPLHDTRREQRLALQHLQRINEQIRANAPLANGPGHYALGRGYLAIGEYERAESEFVQARGSGYDSPALNYAQGQVLGEFYRRGVTAAEFITSPVAKAARYRELETAYLKPAQRYLGKFADETGLPSERLYAEALLAFYGKDDERAMNKAQAAFAEEPWRYEALKLRGDIFMRRGLAEVDQGRFPAALVQFTLAREAFAEAVALGRSDSAVYADQAASWLQVLGAEALGLGQSPAPAFAALLAACAQAQLADSDNTDVLLIKLQGYVWVLQYKDIHGSLEPELQTALTLIAELQRRRPQDSNVYAGAGHIFQIKAHYELNHGENPLSSYQKAISYFDHGSGLDSTGPVTAALAEQKISLGSIYRQMGTHTMQHGGDPRPYFIKALQSFEEYGRASQDLYYSYKYRSMLYKSWSDYDAETGGDPRPLLEQGIAAQNEAIKLHPELGGSYEVLTGIYLARFDYELQQGLDPEPSLQLAERNFRQAMAAKNDAYFEGSARGHILLYQALLDASRRIDPTSKLNLSRQELDKSIASFKDDIALYLDKCRVELTAARWAIQKGQRLAALPFFAAADAAIQQALRINERSGELLRQAAALYHEQAAATPREGQLPIVQHGLEMADRALMLNAQDGEAQALRGALLLLQAQTAASATARDAAARDATSALTKALRYDGNLRREYQPLLVQASALVSHATDEAATR